MIPINPVNDAHALLVIAALNAVLQTGFIGGERDGWGNGRGNGCNGRCGGVGMAYAGDGYGLIVDGDLSGDGGGGLSCAPIHWTTDAALHARRS